MCSVSIVFAESSEVVSEIGCSQLDCSMILDCLRSSQATAVSGYKKRWRHNIAEDEHHDEEGSLIVRVGVSRLGDVCCTTRADLSIASKSDHGGPDDPSEGSSGDYRVNQTRDLCQLLVVHLFVDDLDAGAARSNQGEVKATGDDAAELFSHVFSDTEAIGLSLVSGPAIPIGLLIITIVVVEVIGEDGLDAELDDEARPAHRLGEELLE